MTLDPFSSEKIVDGKIVLTPLEVIASTVLDDDPTEIESDVIIVPDGDAELVFLLSAVATLSPTNVIWSWSISYDGTNFFDYDGLDADDWADITVLEAAMPDARAVIKGRIVAPYCKVKATGTGTDASNTVTVSASVTRKPATLDA